MPISKADIELIHKLSQAYLIGRQDDYKEDFRRVFAVLNELINETQLLWYAGAKAITRQGPYFTQVAAWKSLERAKSRGPGPVHLEGAYVWPEKPKSSMK